IARVRQTGGRVDGRCVAARTPVEVGGLIGAEREARLGSSQRGVLVILKGLPLVTDRHLVLALGPQNIVLRREGRLRLIEGVRVRPIPAYRRIVTAEGDVGETSARDPWRQTRKAGFGRIVAALRRAG